MEDQSTARPQIAIIGMAGRFPGARNVEELWELLAAGREALMPVSDAELLAAGVPQAQVASSAYVKTGGRLADVDLFDAGFFGFSPKQAAELDPQQRLFLECAWTALEHTACDPERFAGRIGVFAGTGVNRYSLEALHACLRQHSTLELIQQTLNADKDFLSTRVSYKLNLKGPSLTLQTACSTSLVAVHVACRSLIGGECDMALAGGVSIQIPHGLGYAANEGGILSPDGHCRAFDAAARGTVPGSGVGIVVLRRLADAIRDGDRIYAIIRNSEINNDGATKVGFTAPSVQGQSDVIRRALADTPARSIGMLEAHGTGTVLGDSVELTALSEVFAAQTVDAQFCALGSLKTNIGHLDAASGVAGLLKAVLCLKHRTLVPSLNFNEPNPVLRAASSPFYVNTQCRPWVAQEFPRRAGVSSFGLGGTNAHVILEEAPPYAATTEGTPLCVFPVSARTSTALMVAKRNLAAFIRARADVSLSQLAYTLQVGRQRFEHRCAWVASYRDELLASLGEDPPAVVGRRHEAVPVTFVLPGRYAPSLAGVQDIYARESGFRRDFDECSRCVRERLDIDLQDVMRAQRPDAAGERSHETASLPLALVAQYCLTRMLMRWAIQPQKLVGHGVGEIAAGCVAGVLSIDEAMRLLAAGTRSDALHALEEAVVSVQWREPTLEYSSSLTGRQPRLADLTVPSYWLTRLQSVPDLKSDLIYLTPDPESLLLLVGTGCLHCDVEQCMAAAPEAAGMGGILQAIAWLWERGAALDWARIPAPGRVGTIELPSYPFERQRHWLLAGDAMPAADASLLAEAGGTDLDRWLYVPIWKPIQNLQAVQARDLRAQAVSWLIVKDGSEIGEALWERLRAAGADVTIARHESRFQQHTAGSFGVDQDEPPQILELMRALRARGTKPNRIIYCAGATPTPASSHANGDHTATGRPVDCPRVLTLVQALAEVHGVVERSLTIVTHNLPTSIAPGGDPAQAALDALARVMTQEFPGLAACVLDVPGGSHSSTEFQHQESYREWVLAAALYPGDAALVACREGRRFVRAFEKMQIEPGQPAVRQLRHRGVYVVTGGTGRLGLALAEWLAVRCQARLLLIGRSGVPERAQWPGIVDQHDTADPMFHRVRSLQAIEAAGGEVSVVAIDIADEARVVQAIEAAERRLGAVNGVFHLAAAIADASADKPLGKVGSGDFATQARPKVHGFQVLERLFASRNLDLAVLFSSNSTLLGGVGLGAYAAANAWLEGAALAGARRPEGVNWLVLNWDGWTHARGGGGDANSISIEEGMESLARALMFAPDPQLVISKQNLEARWQAQVQQRAQSLQRARPVANRKSRPAMKAPPVAATGDLQLRVAEIWEEALSINGIGIHDDFFELGGDSMIMMDILGKIADVFHVEVPLRSFLGPKMTVEALCGQITSRAAKLPSAPRHDVSEPGRLSVT